MTSEGAYVITGFLKTFDLNKDVVGSYELITDEHRKSAASGVARGLVGGALLGPVGLLAGGLSAKENGIRMRYSPMNIGNQLRQEPQEAW